MVPINMSSTILSNDKASLLPKNPTDKQVFVDSEFVQWVYTTAKKVWERRGVVDSIPVVTDAVTGYLSPLDKSLLDSVPAVLGGFGIIVDTKLLLKSSDNPDGVIQGDIKLKSESLDIVCVGADGIKLTCSVPPQLECATQDNSTPGLKFSLSQKFLDTLIVNLPGPQGKTGPKGDKGAKGATGFSAGPKGDKGITGPAITELCKLTGVTYNDVDGLTDTPIVGLDLTNDNGHGCKMVVTKAKVNIGPDRPADKIIATPLSRSVVYPNDPDIATCDITRLANWTLAKPTTDLTPLNLQLLRLANGSNDRDDEPVGFNGTMTLETFVGDIVNEYQNRLTKFDTAWGKEAKAHIQSIDDKARSILSGLANELSQCEFNLPAVEYCVTFTGCDQPLPPPPSPSVAAGGSAQRVNDPMQTNSKIGRMAMGQRSWNVKL